MGLVLWYDRDELREAEAHFQEVNVEMQQVRKELSLALKVQGGIEILEHFLGCIVAQHSSIGRARAELRKVIDVKVTDGLTSLGNGSLFGTSQKLSCVSTEVFLDVLTQVQWRGKNAKHRSEPRSNTSWSRPY